MTEEDFLKRWSRRKREAEAAKAVLPEEKTRDAEARAPEDTVADDSSHAPQAEFDPASLPPIESITAVSDITAFLRDGVPVELTRAALRRVWTADPSIRNFVGLSENAWDFTDPNAMPGFGPLESTDEIRRMIARVVDQIGETVRSQAGDAQARRAEATEMSQDSGTVTAADHTDEAAGQTASARPQVTKVTAENLDSQVLLHSNKEDAAMQHDVTEDVKKTKQLSQRIHGTALPR